MCVSRRLKQFVIILLTLTGLSLLQAVYYYPRLPDTVASHFDSWGNPDGWMSKKTFCMIGPIMIPIVVAFIGGLGLALAAVCASMGPCGSASGNIDNDVQRLQAEQKRKAQESLAEVICLFGLWFSFLTGACLLTVAQLAFQANLRTPQVMKSPIPVLIGYVLAVVLLLIWMCWQARQAMKLLPPRTLPPDIWFPAKRFGWGWGLPVRWQGWVVMILWLGVFFIGLAKTLNNPIAVFFFVPVMILVLLAICWWKGERPGWRWGE